MDISALLGLILYQMAILLVSPLFWLVVVIIGWQIRRTAKMKSDFFHVPREKIMRKTVFNVLLGLGGGFIGSVLLVLLGVSVEEIGIEYLWIVAIVLIMLRQRFMCFAYAGGLIALSKYLFGWPAVNIPQLMGLVAVLHLVEALLIYAGGTSKAMPVYIMGREQRLVGGFVMQSFWPLPLVALSAALTPIGLAGAGDMLAMPGWWAASADGIYRLADDPAYDAGLLHAARFGSFRLQRSGAHLHDAAESALVCAAADVLQRWAASLGDPCGQGAGLSDTASFICTAGA